MHYRDGQNKWVKVRIVSAFTLSPDLAASDYFLFPSSIDFLGAKRLTKQRLVDGYFEELEDSHFKLVIEDIEHIINIINNINKVQQNILFSCIRCGRKNIIIIIVLRFSKVDTLQGWIEHIYVLLQMNCDRRPRLLDPNNWSLVTICSRVIPVLGSHQRIDSGVSSEA